MLGSMASDPPPFDALIFSSHKSSTQTLRHALREGGFEVVSAHGLQHLNLAPGELEGHLARITDARGEPPMVLSVFREPIGRRISSFFQTQGVDIPRSHGVEPSEESFLAKSTRVQLQAALIRALSNQRARGAGESIGVLAEELSLDLDELSFDSSSGFVEVSHASARVLLYRYDLLVEQYEGILRDSVGTPLKVVGRNQSEAKWYGSLYKEFMGSLSLPAHVVEAVWEQNAPLLRFFYGETLHDRKRELLGRFSEK